MIDPARFEAFAEAFTDALMQAARDVQPSLPAGQSIEQYVLDGAMRMLDLVQVAGCKAIEHYVLNTKGAAFCRTGQALGVPGTAQGLQDYLEGR